jgi:hypothetical protein
MLRFDLPKVWSNAIRVDAFVTFVLAGSALLLTPWLLAITAVLGAVRGFGGHHRCPVHGLWSGLLQKRGWAGRKEDVGAKMFAAKILFIASSVALVLNALGSGLWVVPAGALLVFSFLEWAFSFCAGCWAYSLWYRFFPPRSGA